MYGDQNFCWETYKNNNMWQENIVLLIYLGHDFRANVRCSSIWVVIRFPYYLCMNLPFMFAWQFYPPSFYDHAFYQKKTFASTWLISSKGSFPFQSSYPVSSTDSDTETSPRFSRGTMKNSFHHSLFLMSLKKCPSGGGRAERDRVEKKGYLPLSDSCQAAERERAVWCN